MFVVLTKSDCDIKYIIFKVKKNSGFDPVPSSLHHSFSPPRLGSPVWEIPRIICLLISAPETGTHTRGGSGGWGHPELQTSCPLRPPPLGAASPPSPYRALVPFSPEQAWGRSSGSLETSKCPAAAPEVSGPRSTRGGRSGCQDSGSAQDPRRDTGDPELRGLATACETPALRDAQRSRTRCALQPGPRAARGEWASAPGTFQAQPAPRSLGARAPCAPRSKAPRVARAGQGRGCGWGARPARARGPCCCHFGLRSPGSPAAARPAPSPPPRAGCFVDTREPRACRRPVPLWGRPPGRRGSPAGQGLAETRATTRPAGRAPWSCGAANPAPGREGGACRGRLRMPVRALN